MGSVPHPILLYNFSIKIVSHGTPLILLYVLKQLIYPIK